MFGGFFKSKKKVEQGKAAERRDSFYEDDGEDGVVEDDDNEMDDNEYGRRVTEEIAKRKSVNVTKQSAPVPGKPTGAATTSKVPPKAPTPPPAAQPAQKSPPPASTTPKATAAPAHATPVHTAPIVANHTKSTPTPVAQPSKTVTPVATTPVKVATPVPVAATPPVKAATTPVAAAAPPVKAATTPVAPVSASKPVVTVPIAAPSPISPLASPASATSASRPNSAIAAPQPMFVNASAVSAARPNSATTAPVIPKANTVAAARPFSATSAPVIVPIDKNAPPLDPKAIQQLVLMGFSYPASVLALQRCNNKSDLAAEFLLEHSEAEVNQMLLSKTSISPKPVLPLTPNNAPITVSPKAVTPQPSPAVARAVDAPKPAAPVTPVATTPAAASAPATSGAKSDSAAKTTAAPKVAVASPPPTASSVPQATSPTPVPAPAVVASKPDVPVLRQASLKRAKPKEMEAVDTAMAAILAKREALKKQAAPPPASAASSCLSSPRGGYMTDTSSTQGGSVFEKLSTYKTKGVALHEQQEEEDRQRKEAQERRRKALAAPTSGPAAAASSAADTDKQTFEALFNKKTKSMVLNEKQEEEERVAREAHERKWKSLTTPRDSANVTSESDSEVFGKLYTTKLKSHKISEQVEQEEKARLEKVEAHSSGKLGASVAPVTPALVLKKTQSAMLREHFTLEDKQRLEEERAAEERMRKELESPGRRNKRSSSADRSLHASSNEDFASSLDRSLQIARRRSNGDTIDTLEATVVDDIDTEDEDIDDKSKTNGSKPTTNGQTARPSAPGALLSRQSSVRTADVQKQSSFYNKPDSLGKTKSFRANVSNVDKNSLGVPGVVTRERLPQEIQETADHNWVCKVVNAPRDGVSVNGRKAEIMVSVKGVYPTRQHCKAIALANAPPRWATKAKNSLCGICEEAFNKYLKPENCSNCGQLVCADCSDENWPLNMVPESFCDKKTTPRVCAACNVLMEKAVAALKAGDLELVRLLHQTGNVNFHNQYSIFADAPYAIHCAAASGNLQLMKWLVEELYCPARDVLTGDALLNAAGHSALMIAARRGDLAMMRYVVHTLGGNVTEIDEVSVLQRALHVALEAPGAPPVVVPSRKLNSAQSFRRVDKANSNTSLEDSASNGNTINTDSLLLKAADLAMRLRAPASVRADAPTTLSSPAKSDTFSLPPSPSKASAVAPALSPTAINVTAADSPQVSAAPSVPTPSATVITVSSPTKTAAAVAPVTATPSVAAPVIASPPVTLKATPSSADAAALRRAASEARIAAKTAPPAPLQRKPSGNLTTRPSMTRTPSSITPASKKVTEATPTSTATKTTKDVKENKNSSAAVSTPVAEPAPAVAAPVASTSAEEVPVPDVVSGVSEALSMEAAPAEVPEEVLPVEKEAEQGSAPSATEVADVSAAQQMQQTLAEDRVSNTTADAEAEAATSAESPAVEALLPLEEVAAEAPAPEVTTLPVENTASNVTAESVAPTPTEAAAEVVNEVTASEDPSASSAAEVPLPTSDVADVPAVEPDGPAADVEVSSVVTAAVTESSQVGEAQEPLSESAVQPTAEPVAEPTAEPATEPAVEQAAAEPAVAATTAPEPDGFAEPVQATDVPSVSGEQPTVASEPSSPTSPNATTKESPNSKSKKSKKKGGAKASTDTAATDITDTSGSATPASPAQQVARSPSQRSVAAPAVSGAGAEFTKSSKRMNSMKVEAPASENPPVRMSNLHRTNSSRSQSADGNSPSQPSNNN